MSSQENGERVEKGDAIEAERDKAGFTFKEDVAPGLRVEMELKNIFHSTQSEFQKIDVIETYCGKTLVTDGKTQSAQLDEFAYHESLVHPPLLKAADTAPVRSVFIGGGGELATAREALKHKSVERVVMVDLDETVIEVCKKYLPEWGGEEVATNSRLDLIVGDAYKYLLETTETFDVIIMDISDPIEAGPGIMLYTKEFYEHAITRLNMPQGVFVTQAGAADSIPPPHAFEKETDTSCFGPIQNTLRSVFDCVIPYSTNVPSFGSDWGFVMSFQAPGDASTRKQLETEWAIDCPVDKIDKLIGEGIDGGESALRFYDGITHRSMFALTKILRKKLAEDQRIMTRDNPIFMF